MFKSKFKKHWKTIFLIAGIIVIILLLIDSKNFDWRKFNYNYEAESETINIGFISSLSGSNSIVGVQSLSAAQLAVDEINSEGGIDGKAIRLINEDGKCTEQGGYDAAKKLASQNIAGLVGGLCSSESLGFIDVIDEYKIPTISHCSSSTELSGISDYFYRIYPSDSIQGLFAANNIKNEMNVNRVAIVYLDDAWGRGLKKVFSESFQSQGGTITSENSFNQSENNFDEIWKQIETEQVDLVYFLGYDTDTIKGINSLNKLDTNFALFGADSWDDINIWEKVNVGNRTVVYTVFDDKEYDKVFITKMQERGVYTISACVPQAYDAVKILAEAIKESDRKNSIIDILKNIEYNQGVSKKMISFDMLGNIIGAQYKVQKIRDYKKEIEKSLVNIEPELKKYLLIF